MTGQRGKPSETALSRVLASIDPEVVALHGNKGEPGYHLLHHPKPEIASAAEKIYKKFGQAAVKVGAVGKVLTGQDPSSAVQSKAPGSAASKKAVAKRTTSRPAPSVPKLPAKPAAPAHAAGHTVVSKGGKHLGHVATHTTMHPQHKPGQMLAHGFKKETYYTAHDSDGKTVGYHFEKKSEAVAAVKSYVEKMALFDAKKEANLPHAPEPTGPGKVAVGSLQVTPQQLQQAIDTLEKASGIMVKQPLVKVGNPLADVDYKALAKGHDSSKQTKPAFIAMLKSKMSMPVSTLEAEPGFKQPGEFKPGDKVMSTLQLDAMPDGTTVSVGVNNFTRQPSGKWVSASGMEHPSSAFQSPFGAGSVKFVSYLAPGAGSKVPSLPQVQSKLEPTLGTGIAPGVYSKVGGKAFIMVNADGTGVYTNGKGESKSISAAAVAANYKAGMSSPKASVLGTLPSELPDTAPPPPAPPLASEAVSFSSAWTKVAGHLTAGFVNLAGLSTGDLSKLIKEMSAQTGSKAVGVHMSGAVAAQKRQWIHAVYKGDLKTAFAIEDSTAKAKLGKPHSKAAIHPGNVGEGQLDIKPAVEGELKAGTPISGQDVSQSVSLYSISSEEANAILFVAKMQHAEGLGNYARIQWARAFMRGDQLTVDGLSLQARKNVQSGKLLSEPLTAPVPPKRAGEQVPPKEGWKPFNVKLNRAKNLTPEQVSDYLSQLFSSKARKALLDASEDDRSALVQLHFLSTIPKDADGHEAPSVAAKKFSDLQSAIEKQVGATPVADIGSVGWQLGLPSFPPPNTVYTREPSAPGTKKLAGVGQKFFVTDDEGRRWLFKVAPEPFRADVEHAAHDAARFFGFSAADSRVVTVDGMVGQVQGLLDPKEIRGTAPADLNDVQLQDVLREHIFDWATGNDDAHDQNFLVQANSRVVGIDKGRVWGPGFGKYKLKRGQLSYQSHVYYEDVYDAIVSGKISPERVQKAYRAVMSRAKQMQARSDESYEAILDRAFSHSSYPVKGQAKVDFVKRVVDRKNGLVSDFEKFWDGILAEAGVDKPEANPELAPGIFSGSSHEFMEQVKVAGASGHPTFYGGTDLEDGHVIVQRVELPSGFLQQGSAQLRASADKKLAGFLSQNFSGVTIQSTTQESTFKSPAYSSFEALSDEFYTGVYHGVKTISTHAKDGNYNQDKVKKLEETLVSLRSHKKASAVADPFPGHPELTAPKKAMLDHYIKAAEEALAAKVNGVPAPSGFTYYKLDLKPPVQGASKVDLPSKFQVKKRDAAVALGKFENGQLRHEGGLTSTGQSGQEYLVTLPSGTEITYRPYHGFSTKKSQQGQLRFQSADAENPAALDEVRDFLELAGVQMGEAEESDHELFYWRHLYGVLNERAESTAAKLVKAKFALVKPDKTSDPDTELARWREVWAEYAGWDKVGQFVARKGYLPTLSSGVGGQDTKHGRPVWFRFDVDLSEARKTKKPLIHSLSGSSTLVAKSGGLLSTEERARVMGQFISGMSSETDQQRGSAGFVFTRQNQDYGSVFLDPALAATTTSYSFDGDNYGSVDARKSKSAFDFAGHTVHSGSGNELLVKYNAAFRDYLMLMVVNEADRADILKHYKSIGIDTIRGVPIGEVFVTSKQQAAALAKVKERLKGGWYDTH